MDSQSFQAIKKNRTDHEDYSRRLRRATDVPNFTNLGVKLSECLHFLVGIMDLVHAFRSISRSNLGADAGAGHEIVVGLTLIWQGVNEKVN